MLHWHMIDLTYCDLNETKAGDRRWDGKVFVDRPHFDSLPKKARKEKKTCAQTLGENALLLKY